MSVKRETSISVADLHCQTVSESIKRLAISSSTLSTGELPRTYSKPIMLPINSNNTSNKMNPQTGLSIEIPKDGTKLMTVLSTSTENFFTKYDLGPEIGKGGFSSVHSCREKKTGEIYAVKIVDLRPLRLRERFNPKRLKREVDIMRRLHHPNIIQFIEVFESQDDFMIVMEYCPGQELFDVILAKKHLSEAEARIIFAQIARALFYLHSLNILHRDIKPENILILNKPDSATGYPVAKILDFGLSRIATAQSAAKTFVGTPCYLAPEVEYTSRGIGGTYGLPADCWSLGAVLYVMLVARFPEFEKDPNTQKVVVKLSPFLWDGVSNEAKELIRALMNTNPKARLTAGMALQHPWLQAFRATPVELARIANSSTALGIAIQEEEQHYYTKMGPENDRELTSSGVVVEDSAMIVRSPVFRTDDSYNKKISKPQIAAPSSDQIQLGPLLHLQRNIALSLEEAITFYEHMPMVTTQIHKCAKLCQQQLVDSTKMIRKFEHTAEQAKALFDDLEVVVEEGESALARDMFGMIREWVVELREMVTRTQALNHATMMQIQAIIEESAYQIEERDNKKIMDTIRNRLVEYMESHRQKLSDGSTVNENQLLELMLSMLGSNDMKHIGAGDINHDASSNSTSLITSNLPPHSNDIAMEKMASNDSSCSEDTSSSAAADLSPSSTSSMLDIDEGPHFAVGESIFRSVDSHDAFKAANVESSGNANKQVNIMEVEDIDCDVDIDEDVYEGPKPSRVENRNQTPMVSVEQMNLHDNTGAPNSAFNSSEIVNVRKANGNHSPVAQANGRLLDALRRLHQVDKIFTQLGFFWAHTEIVLDSLLKKGQHVEQFVGFSTNPRLLARFKERMEEYRRFWEGISLMCSNYINGAQHNGGNSPSSIGSLNSFSSSESHSTASKNDLDILDIKRSFSP